MSEERDAVPPTDAMEAVQTILGHQFSDMDLLRASLTHASIAENRLASNERLEFLGDAVLGLVICEELYTRYPQYLEGELTRIKSVVVSRETCAQVADRLGLVQHLSLGKGITEAASLPASLAACAYEAITGAVYLDGGLEPARRFILAHMSEEIDRVFAGEHRLNYKSLLQQHAQRDLAPPPTTRSSTKKGPTTPRPSRSPSRSAGAGTPAPGAPPKRTPSSGPPWRPCESSGIWKRARCRSNPMRRRPPPRTTTSRSATNRTTTSDRALCARRSPSRRCRSTADFSVRTATSRRPTPPAPAAPWPPCTARNSGGWSTRMRRARGRKDRLQAAGRRLQKRQKQQKPKCLFALPAASSLQPQAPASRLKPVFSANGAAVVAPALLGLLDARGLAGFPLAAGERNL